MPVRYVSGYLNVTDQKPGEGGEHPEHPIVIPPEPPLGIWGPTDPRPTPPIFIPPDSIGPGLPSHPIYLPVFPAHPIVIPPDSIGPGVPTHPIYLPPVISGPPGPWPSPPIFLPPDAIGPGQPAHPIYLPPVISGPPGPWPTPPIHIPGPPVTIPQPPAEMPPQGYSWAYAYVAILQNWLYVAVDNQAMPHVEPHGGKTDKK